jgi:hypothetical protein
MPSIPDKKLTRRPVVIKSRKYNMSFSLGKQRFPINLRSEDSFASLKMSR